ncbi:MAG: sensor histidine kinase [Hyphomicrobium sp.]
MSSLKSRLIAAATLWIAIGMIAAGLVLAAVFKHHVTEQFYSELYVHLDELERLTTFEASGQPHLQSKLSDPRFDVAQSGYYWEIKRAPDVLVRSASLAGPELATPQDALLTDGVHTHVIDGPTGRMLVAEKIVHKAAHQPPLHFIIGTDQRHLDTVLASFNSTLGGALTGFGLSMVFAATILIVYALGPFGQLQHALAKVRSGAVKTLDGKFPSEVVPLVDDLNSLLSATAELIQRARTQAGNMAHGLKTPLAILTDEADRIAEDGLSTSANTILLQCRKMQTQIDYQIARARAAALRSSPGIVADVNKAATEVLGAMRRLHKSANLEMTATIPAAARVACDPLDLNEIIANVVDNACKHAVSQVRLAATTDPTAKCLNIVIDDDGKGLPAQSYDVVFNIGERLDSRTSGSGLGLAIVRDLVRLYGGDVHLAKAALGGLSVVISLPMAAQDVI